MEEGTLDTAKKFTGKELDDSTGLYDYGARMYDAGLGRFVSGDVVEPDLTNPQTLNRYTYCLNNPLKYVDPTGEWWELAVVVVSQYIMTVVSSPDFQQDVDQLYIDAITGDVGGMAIDAVSVAIPGLYAVTAKGAIKAADKVIDAVKVVDKAGDVGKAAEKGAKQWHHLFPKQFKKDFKKAGLDIEKYKKTIPKSKHTLKPDGVHTKSGGNWNAVWEKFFKETRGKATKNQVRDQLKKMMKDFKIGGKAK